MISESGTTTKNSTGGKTASTTKASQAKTTAATSKGAPAAAQIGSTSFKPGTLYKGSVVNFRRDGDKVTLGTWWWDLKGIIAPMGGVSVDMILDMLIANKVTEIYLDVSKMMTWEEEQEQGGLTADDTAAGIVSEKYVRGFVKKCHKYGIRVAALTGASGDGVLSWIDPGKNQYLLHSFADKIAAYQKDAASDEKFYAIHLDVEPHTMSNWNQNRSKYTGWLANLAIEARKQCNTLGIQLEFDIWSWFTAQDTVTVSGSTVNILDVMTKNCNALGIMSYYNTGAGQYSRATDLELAYAKKNNCRLIAGTETIKLDTPNVSYYSSGKAKLITEQGVLRSLLDGCGYANVGGAIHQVYSWYSLMTR